MNDGVFVALNERWADILQWSFDEIGGSTYVALTMEGELVMMWSTIVAECSVIRVGSVIYEYRELDTTKSPNALPLGVDGSALRSPRITNLLPHS